MTNKLSQPVIVCAACKHPTLDLMLVGPRHWDSTMNQQYKHLCQLLPPYPGFGIQTSKWAQGFIDQHGTFYDRREAMIVAKAAGQKIDMKRNGPDPDVLHSEGLY